VNEKGIQVRTYQENVFLPQQLFVTFFVIVTKCPKVIALAEMSL